MTRRSQHPQTRRHVWIRDEDWEWLNHYSGIKGLTPGLIVRELLHKYVLRAKEAQAQSEDGEAK